MVRPYGRVRVFLPSLMSPPLIVTNPYPKWFENKDSTIPDYALATCVFNDPTGIRTHPYSINMSINPLWYPSIQ